MYKHLCLLKIQWHFKVSETLNSSEHRYDTHRYELMDFFFSKCLKKTKKQDLLKDEKNTYKIECCLFGNSSV